MKQSRQRYHIKVLVPKRVEGDAGTAAFGVSPGVAGLIAGEAQGNWIVYRVTDDAAAWTV
ncbi:hypothetical protein [Methanoculleus receptaculi]|uniref:Uncharacterized protein n=1 Tax=Methanoculleus receptaculi TaxID=394967 RepID=A0AAX4FUA9_9EURY|nr:hypothetical protein [Methanoculleus receptaculi]WOX57462.1 hypothetical protein R6Y96_09225 [Methanoculleus receptaculi]